MNRGDGQPELTPLEAGGRHDRNRPTVVIAVDGATLVGDARSMTRLHARLSYVALGLAPLVRRYRVVLATDVLAGAGFDAVAVAQALTRKLDDIGGWVPAVCLLTTPVAGPDGLARVPEPSAVADLAAGDRTVVCAYDLAGPIDGDAVTSRLAVDLGARHLLLLSDVDVVHRTSADGRDVVVRTLCADDAAVLPTDPRAADKLETAVRFVDATGAPAAIGALPEAASVLAGRSGTTITPSAPLVSGGVR